MSPLTDEDLDAIKARHKEAACEAGYSSGWSASWLSAEDVPDLIAEVRRRGEAPIARFRSVIDDFLAAPEMFARDPECGAHVVYGAMLASGGNGRTWYDACLAVGLARGNIAVAAKTWDDVRRLATHLHETAETWAVTR